MRTWVVAVAVCSACSSASTSKTEGIPETMLPQTAADIAAGEIELYEKGADIGFEKYAVTKHTSGGYGIKGNALWGDDRWEFDMRYRDDWSVLEVVMSKLVDEGSGRECTLRLRHNEGMIEWVLDRDGLSSVVSKLPGEWIYWLATRPIITQQAACARASISEQGLKNVEGDVLLGPRESVDVGNGRKLDRVKIGDDIELYCDDKQFAFFRYPRHGFLATRPEYRVFSQGLAKTDVVEKPWGGDVPCPGSRE